jgi:hypothetical protein
MPTFSFAFPLAPERVAALYALIEEIRARSEEHARSRGRLAVRGEMIRIQTVAHGYLVLIEVEGDDPERFVEWLSESEHPYDRWFAERTREIFGPDALEAASSPWTTIYAWKRQGLGRIDDERVEQTGVTTSGVAR